jgi:hypothetical protein
LVTPTTCPQQHPTRIRTLSSSIGPVPLKYRHNTIDTSPHQTHQ